MNRNILFYSHNARSAEVWLHFAKDHTGFARGLALLDEHDRAVVMLDEALYDYDQYKVHMARLGLSLAAKEKEAIQCAEDMRQAHASAQKNKEDQESLQRIKEYFAALEIGP